MNAQPTAAHAQRTVSIRELRQNPTDAINEVESGHVVTITRNHRAVADIVPHTPRRGATPAEIDRLIHPDQGVGDWARDLKDSRAEVTEDPWESR
ncbi:hypothetical protein GCM10028798_12160 [Humibacter antri]